MSKFHDGSDYSYDAQLMVGPDDKVRVQGKLRDVSGLNIGTPIRDNLNRGVIGIVDCVDAETNTYSGYINKADWEKLIGEESLGFSMEFVG